MALKSLPLFPLDVDIKDILNYCKDYLPHRCLKNQLQINRTAGAHAF